MSIKKFKSCPGLSGQLSLFKPMRGLGQWAIVNGK